MAPTNDSPSGHGLRCHSRSEAHRSAHLRLRPRYILGAQDRQQAPRRYSGPLSRPSARAPRSCMANVARSSCPLHLCGACTFLFTRVVYVFILFVFQLYTKSSGYLFLVTVERINLLVGFRLKRSGAFCGFGSKALGLLLSLFRYHLLSVRI